MNTLELVLQMATIMFYDGHWHARAQKAPPGHHGGYFAKDPDLGEACLKALTGEATKPARRKLVEDEPVVRRRPTLFD